jgi:hypothetical protein
METAVLILAVAGFVAVAARVLRALLGVLTVGADVLIAREVAATRANRGDLTGLEEAKLARGEARRRRYVALGVLSIWAGLLMVPALTPWPNFLYAAYSLLWLLPHRRERVLPT